MLLVPRSRIGKFKRKRIGLSNALSHGRRPADFQSVAPCKVVSKAAAFFDLIGGHSSSGPHEGHLVSFGPLDIPTHEPGFAHRTARRGRLGASKTGEISRREEPDWAPRPPRSAKSPPLASAAPANADSAPLNGKSRIRDHAEKSAGRFPHGVSALGNDTKRPAERPLRCLLLEGLTAITPSFRDFCL